MTINQFKENEKNGSGLEKQENPSDTENCSHFPEWNENIQKNVVGYH